MTVSSLTNRNDFVGNGATKIFSYSFKIFLNTELEVKVEDLVGVITTLALTTDFTVTGVGETAGGTITLVDSSQAWLSGGFLITDYKISIQRTRALNQETDIRNQGDFFPETHEDEFDKQVMTDQQLDRLAQRSLKLPFTEVPTSIKVILPSVSDRTSKFLAFDASGNPIASAGGITSVPVSAFMATVLDDVNAILARATLDAVGLTGNETIAGNKTFSGLLTMAAQIAMGANKITGLAEGSANGDAIRFEQLQIVQVVTEISEATFSTSSSAYQTTNLSATITPRSTSNKILIFAVGETTRNGTNSLKCSIFRGSTNTVSDFISRENTTTALTNKKATTLMSTDLPASVSPLTYSVKILSGDGASSVGWGLDSGTQTIILMEVKI